MIQKATVKETKDDKENKPYPFPIDRLTKQHASATANQEIVRACAMLREATPEHVEQVAVADLKSKEKPYPFPIDR